MRGDWSVRRPDVAPGGWAFEFANDGYPDIDDTAEVVLALAGSGDTVPARGRAIERGVAWVVGMQSSRRRLGRVRRRQHPPADREAAVLRLRCGHRPAVGRRHRARRRDARRRAAWLEPTPRSAACAGCWTRRSPTARGSAGGVRTTSTAPAPPCRPWSPLASTRLTCPFGGPSRWLRAASERRRRLGRGPALLRRRIVARPRHVDGLADGVGAARPARRRRRDRGRRPRGRVAGRHPAGGRRLGRGRSTPAPASPATSTSTMSCTDTCFPLSALGRYARRLGVMTAVNELLVVTALRTRVRGAGRAGARRAGRPVRHGPEAGASVAAPAGRARSRTRSWSPASPAG